MKYLAHPTCPVPYALIFWAELLFGVLEQCLARWQGLGVVLGRQLLHASRAGGSGV